VNTPLVSVVIPVWNDAARLAACLNALEGQSYAAERIEILVVDNGSDDDIAALLRRWPRIRLLKEERVGSYASRNRGVSASSGEVLAFTDADCVPLPDWIAEGVACLQRTPNCGLVGGRLEPCTPQRGRPSLAELYDRTFNLRQAFYVSRLQFAATANLFAWRHVFDRTGGFSNELFSGGDVEWGRRVRAHGYELVYCDAAGVRHAGRSSWDEVLRKERRSAGGQVAMRRLAGRPPSQMALIARELRHVLPGQIKVALGSPVPSGVLSRAALCLATLLMSAVRIFELRRVSAGGEPRRA
jgi:GT2 family glycosyltransferase